MGLPVQDVIQKGESFMTSVRFDQSINQLKIGMPLALKGRRFEIAHVKDRLVLTLADKGCKVSGNDAYACIGFGVNKWLDKKVPQLPQGRIECKWEGYGFSIPLPPKKANTNGKTFTQKERIGAALRLINDFVTDNGYDVVVSDNRITLTKTTIIGEPNDD